MHIPTHLADLFDATALTRSVMESIETRGALASALVLGETITAAKTSTLALGQTISAAQASVMAWKDREDALRASILDAFDSRAFKLSILDSIGGLIDTREAMAAVLAMGERMKADSAIVANIGKNWAELGADVLNFQSALAPPFADIDAIIEQGNATLREIEPDATELGRRGWAVPMWGFYLCARDIVREVPADRTDEFFLNSYEADPSRETEVIERITTSAGLARWRAMIEQAVRAYTRGDYLVVVPTMLTVTEGAVAAASNSFHGRRTRVPVQARALKAAAQRDFPRMALASVVGWAEVLFADHSFGADRPAMLNRHWVLHGRDVPDWTKVDCLRVFQFLDTLSFVCYQASEPSLAAGNDSSEAA